MMHPVILTRDGVINRLPKANVRSPDDWHALPGSIRAIARLYFAHFNVIVVTNQPDVGEGHLDSGTLIRIHAKMKTEVAREGGRIDVILHCPHRVDEQCPCHMPKPGLMHELSRRLDRDLKRIPFVTDSLDNARMAQSLGMRSLLVNSGADANDTPGAGIDTYPDLGTAADSLIRQQGVV